MGPQAFIWFGIAGGAVVLALTLLFTRYVRQDPRAMHSGGGFTLFAICMLLFAVGAVVAGLAAVGAGR